MILINCPKQKIRPVIISVRMVFFFSSTELHSQASLWDYELHNHVDAPCEEQEQQEACGSRDEQTSAKVYNLSKLYVCYAFCFGGQMTTIMGMSKLLCCAHVLAFCCCPLCIWYQQLRTCNCCLGGAALDRETFLNFHHVPQGQGQYLAKLFPAKEPINGPVVCVW